MYLSGVLVCGRCRGVPTLPHPRACCDLPRPSSGTLPPSFAPCIPTRTSKPPDQARRHRLIATQAGGGVRLFTPPRLDWTELHPLIRDAAVGPFGWLPRWSTARRCAVMRPAWPCVCWRGRAMLCCVMPAISSRGPGACNWSWVSSLRQARRGELSAMSLGPSSITSPWSHAHDLGGFRSPYWRRAVALGLSARSHGQRHGPWRKNGEIPIISL
jgi:hypothetical protein